MPVKTKDPAAVALGRRGGKKGGPARAAKLTPEQRSESARRAVQARWAKAKKGSHRVKAKTIGSKPTEAAPATTVHGTSKKALHLCLKRIKEAKNDSELRRLTAALQEIVFHRQYRNT